MPEPDTPDALAPFGPFSSDGSPLERAFQFGLLTGLVHALCGGSSPAAQALYRARSFQSADAAVALAELGRLTPVQKRRVLGSYMARVSPGSRTIVNGKRKGVAA